MAYQPPPKFYPPVIFDESSQKFELTQPWHYWFLNLGRNLGLEQTETGTLGTRLTAVESEVDVLQSEVDVLQAASAAGYTGTVTLAKITGGGTDGSLTITNGLITAVTAPT